MAVGRGSMERAAKAAGGDAAKKTGDKAPGRRMTISEIVGEPSYVEPVRAAKPAGNKMGVGSGGSKPTQVSKAVAANPSEAAAKMASAEKTAPVRPAETAVKAEPEKAASAVRPEPEKAASAARPEPEVRPAPAVEKPELKVSMPQKSAAEKAAIKAPGVPEAPKTDEVSKAPEAHKTSAVLKKEEEIVYQKSSGMLERAAEPNERFGIGDAMPVYYF